MLEKIAICVEFCLELAHFSCKWLGSIFMVSQDILMEFFSNWQFYKSWMKLREVGDLRLVWVTYICSVVFHIESMFEWVIIYTQNVFHSANVKSDTHNQRTHGNLTEYSKSSYVVQLTNTASWQNKGDQIETESNKLIRKNKRLKTTAIKIKYDHPFLLVVVLVFIIFNQFWAWP